MTSYFHLKGLWSPVDLKDLTFSMIFQKHISPFEFENEIKSDEGQLLNQQNILKKEDFDKKISELRNKFKSYQENKKLKNTELNKLRNHVGNKILKIINEILTEYSKNNSISLVVEKKNVGL